MAFCTILLLLATGLLAFAIMKGALDQGFHLKGPWILEQNDGPAGDWVFAGVKINSADSTNVNIVIRGLPTVLTQWYVNTQLVNLSMRLRINQCWSDLATRPRTLNRSLALTYSTQMSYFVPKDAISKGHYRLATVSSIAFIGQLWPAFVAGLCSFYRTEPDQVLVTFSWPAFVIVCTFILLSAVALILGWPFEHETLMRESRSIADNLRPFVHSSITSNPSIRYAAICRTRKDMYANVYVKNFLYELYLKLSACGKFHLMVDITGHQYEGVAIKASNIVTIPNLVASRQKHRQDIGPFREWIRNSFSGHMLRRLFGQGVLEQHWYAGQNAPGLGVALMNYHQV